MSTKLIGIGAIVIVGLTAAAGGYTLLRDPAPAVQVVPTALVPAESAAVPPATQFVVTTPEVRAAVPTRPNTVAPAPAREPVADVRTAEPALPQKPVRPPTQTPSQSQPAGAPPTPDVVVAAAQAPERYVPSLEPASAAAPTPVVEPSPDYEELTVARHSVIGIRLEQAVSTRTARVEDRITASVSRDVTVDSRVAIPIGATLEGTITTVEHGGKFRERPRLGLRFDTMILADGTRLSISTDTIFREGDSPSADATAKVGGGAVAGAILGGVLGGKKGAAIGGAAGAAGGTAAVMRSDGEEASLRAGAPLTVRLSSDLTVQVKR